MASTPDLFNSAPAAKAPRGAVSRSPVSGDYSAKDIEILEGLEPVRRRPAMYIGGTDSSALHHLFAEVLANAMAEAVAAHATRTAVSLAPAGPLPARDTAPGPPLPAVPPQGPTGLAWPIV